MPKYLLHLFKFEAQIFFQNELYKAMDPIFYFTIRLMQYGTKMKDNNAVRRVGKDILVTT